MKFLKLIRWQNLLFIIYIMILMRYCIIKPILSAYGLPLLFPQWQYLLLILMTVLIAAAGYMINDYFDLDADKLNNKKNPITEGYFSKNFVFYTHLIFNIIAIAIGFYLSYQISLISLGFIYFLIAGLLWFYSNSYKYQFLIGNLIIATLAALTVFLPTIYEIPLQIQLNGDYLLQNHININVATAWTGAFATFAFLMTLIREIVKDAQDMDGDKAQGAKTLPIVLKIKGTKITIIFLWLITTALIIWIYYDFLKDTLSLIYISIAIILPMLLFLYKLIKAKTKKDFAFLSALLKIIMFLGTTYSLLACYQFHKL